MGARDLRRLIRKRDRWHRRKKKSGNQQDAKKYKTLKQETQRQLRKAYWSYIEDIVTQKWTGKKTQTGIV